MKRLLLLLAFMPLLSHAQSDFQRSITVLGEARREIDPDELELMIIFNEKENVKKENELTLKEIELKKLINSYGIPDGDLVIENFSASRFGSYKSVSTKILLSKAYKLRIVKIDTVDELINNLFEIGADNVTVWDLKSNEIKRTRSEVATEALDNARAKAELLAKHVGNELGRVLTIQEYTKPSAEAYEYDKLKFSTNTYTAYGAEAEVGIKRIVVSYAITVVFELK